MQQLENLAYQSTRVLPQKQQIYFVVGDLERMSASVLYTGDLPSFSNGGLVPSGDSYGAGDTPADRVNLGGPVKYRPGEDFTVLDLPNLGVQLHMHERPGGKALFKDHKGNKIAEINSYDAAIAALSDKGREIYEELCKTVPISQKIKWGIK
ncbi:MAG: hypothetical protein Q7S56_02790 [Nanoarchaeota archaeon]|nr:hypothetical protein [Nanoarchaeota archaeon]